MFRLSNYESTLARFAFLHWIVVLVMSAAFRVYLLTRPTNAGISAILYGFSFGAVFDTAVTVYSFIPFLLLLLLIPTRLVQKIGTKRILTFALAFDLFIFLLGFVCEYIFYDEFRDRANFIAVDYLVYTHEVLRNLWESYPVIPVLSGLAIIATFLAFVLAQFSFRSVDLNKPRWFSGLRFLGAYMIMFFLIFLAVSEPRTFKQTDFSQELFAKSGFHALFAAYEHNEIKFDRFYTTMDGQKAAAFVYKTIKADHEEDVPGDSEVQTSIVRNIREEKKFSNLNVVLVAMESMSARFMKTYGNTQDLTPNLDRLTREGLFFNRIYSTGTRTVRGLEALMLSIPPTPGQSIVRRPAGIGVFNLGTVFREKHYATNFIYGGRSTFDNMGTFFRGNGFDVHDQATFPANEIQFSNAWGVSDEDLFNQVLKISDASAARGEKFFQVVLTTSNHRPYTYPTGRVPLPPGKGREGAIQFSDYSVGKFLEDARKKPWFDDTIFIFVADHNASVAGQVRIDPNDYLIPMIIYSPKWVKPEIISHLGSQIDLAPTLLELLNTSYQSRFFGMELQDDNPGRAFVATYQNVGYLTESSLTILSPNREVEEFSWDGHNAQLLHKGIIPTLPADASESLAATVSYYKTASDWFSERLLEEKRHASDNINLRN